MLLLCSVHFGASPLTWIRSESACGGTALAQVLYYSSSCTCTYLYLYQLPAVCTFIYLNLYLYLLAGCPVTSSLWPSAVFPNRRVPKAVNFRSGKSWWEVKFLLRDLVYLKAFVESVKPKPRKRRTEITPPKVLKEIKEEDRVLPPITIPNWMMTIIIKIIAIRRLQNRDLDWRDRDRF